MALNPYFNNHDYKPTQDLMEDLVEESIKINGINVYYIPRRFVDLDQIFGEDSSSFFKDAIQIEMYMDNYSGFAGEREIISKFGLEIRDTLSLVVSKRRFQKESAKFPVMSDRPVEISNPMEGDLIWYPFTKALFEIKFVDTKEVFFQFGKLYTYKLECELFKYSHESLDTGISDIDAIEDDISKSVVENLDYNQDGVVDDVITSDQDSRERSDNTRIETTTRDLIDFREIDPFSENKY
jgi:hypothetical protein